MPPTTTAKCFLYLRENGIVPPASRPNPPELKDAY